MSLRTARHRLVRATGVGGLAPLETRTGELEVAVAEELGLQRPLTVLVGELEAHVAGLLERRHAEDDPGA